MTEAEKIYQFIKSCKLAVISTVTSNVLPQAAVVGFAEKENLELIFGTSTETRKYKNLKSNPRVAVVIGWDQGRTVQYEGEAIEIQDEKERQEAVNIFLSKVPSAAKFISDSKEAIFKVTPKWIRYSDLSKDPADVIELTF